MSTLKQPMLFTPLTIKDVELKNRIVMSPMCMHSADEEGNITDWLKIHYASRALGGVGLIFLESLVISPTGMIDPNDIGIWADSHVKGLSELVQLIHNYGTKVGAQISHAGRLCYTPGVAPIAPSAIPYNEKRTAPRALSIGEIKEIICEFGEAARRASEAGFDILEIHTAHGYLLNEFLSPLSNQRTDEYGGSPENRYRIVHEIIQTVRKYWEGKPIFVRISSTDYAAGGNTPESFVTYANWMKDDGIDLVDCSSGGIASVKVNAYPNYQVPAADLIRNKVGIKTGAVGLIEIGKQAEEILQNGRADLVFVGRAILRDPFWARTAAVELNEDVNIPVQYTRYGSVWLHK